MKDIYRIRLWKDNRKRVWCSSCICRYDGKCAHLLEGLEIIEKLRAGRCEECGYAMTTVISATS